MIVIATEHLGCIAGLHLRRVTSIEAEGIRLRENAIASSAARLAGPQSSSRLLLGNPANEPDYHQNQEHADANL